MNSTLGKNSGNLEQTNVFNNTTESKLSGEDALINAQNTGPIKPSSLVSTGQFANEIKNAKNPQNAQNPNLKPGQATGSDSTSNKES